MMNLETRKDATAFFEGLREYFEKHTKFSENHIRRNSFDEKNERLGGLAISLFPKGIKDLLFTDLSDSIFTFHIQFWNLWKDKKTKRVFMFNLWAGDNADKAKDFNAKKHLFSNKKSDTNSGQAYNVMNKENYVDINSTSIPQKLRSVPNEVDETILYPLIADTFEKMNDDFYPELAKLFGVRTDVNINTKELIRLFELHKKTDFYKSREKQITEFVPIAREIILETLKKPFLKKIDFDGFLQMFKANRTLPTFLNYLKINVENNTFYTEIEQKIGDFSSKGFTSSPMGSIMTEISPENIQNLKFILQNDALNAKNKLDAISIYKKIKGLRISHVTEPIFSPWLYYLNPTVFPVINNSITDFLKFIECKDEYTDIIEKFHELKSILGVEDFGYIDSFAHYFRLNSEKIPDVTEMSDSIITPHPLNQILYGPPGTGKTYHTINKALAIVENKAENAYENTERTELKERFDALSESGQIGFVTFHQSMSYEDFVEGIKPEINKESKTEQTEPENNDEKNLTKSVGFDIRPGIFKKMAELAEENPQTPYVLIIDEINRGNVAGIFGELITLIEEDKRIGKREALRVTLPYSQKPFGVPANLHLIGTMNTADRSVEALDTALRRRFVFDEMLPKPELLKNQNIEGIDLTELLTTINTRLEKLLDRDHHIGHAYLWNINEISNLRHAFYNKIIPQLQEYFYRDYVKIGLVLGTGFVEKKSEKIKFAPFDNKEQDYSDFADKPTFEIKQIKNDSDFIKAVTSIYKTVES